MMDIQRDKNYLAGAVQCDDCGGTGGVNEKCKTCEAKGWLPKGHPRGRKCYNDSCESTLPPSHVAVYCTNQCAMDDA